MKKSKVFRKAVNQMRALSDVPTPARRFHYPPTFANAVGSTPNQLVGTCKRPVGTVQVKRKRFGKLRPKQDVEVRCGGRVYLRRGALGKRRVVCVDCRARKRERQKALRVQRQLHSRFGIATRPPREEKTARFKRFLPERGAESREPDERR